MQEFKTYERNRIGELGRLTVDLRAYDHVPDLGGPRLAIGIADADAGHVLTGGARNPKNHADQWLVAQQYFRDNFIDLSAKRLMVDLIAIAGAVAQSTNNLMLAHYAGMAAENHKEALDRIAKAVRYDFSNLDTSPFSDTTTPRFL